MSSLLHTVREDCFKGGFACFLIRAFSWCALLSTQPDSSEGQRAREVSWSAIVDPFYLILFKTPALFLPAGKNGLFTFQNLSHSLAVTFV